MTIDGKLYHVSKNGYAIDRYAKGLHEIDGGMYYVKEDGSFLTNSAVEYLTFDANGRYTSGNATLDSYVDQALAACTNSGMTKAQKLRAAYLYVRDHGAYLARPHQARGTTAWAEESALFMFEHKKGQLLLLCRPVPLYGPAAGLQCLCSVWRCGPQGLGPCMGHDLRERSSLYL